MTTTRTCLVGLALWAAACTPEQERKLTVVAASLPLHETPDPASATLATVRLGSQLKGFAPGYFDSKDHWRIRLNDGRMASAPMEAALETVPAPTTMHVTALETARLKDPYPKGALLERLPMGTVLQVIRDQPFLLPGFGITVVDGRPTGFVQLDALGAAPPSTEEAMARARKLVAEGSFLDAAAIARAVARMRPEDTDAPQLAAAVLRALGDPEWAAWRRRVPEGKPVLPPSDPDLRAGVVAYTCAARVPARRGPGFAVKPVMDLSVNTRVSVRGTDGKWARVAWAGVLAPQSLVVVPFDPPPAEEPAPRKAAPPAKKAAPRAADVEMYVPAGMLCAEPLDKKTLRAEARDAMGRAAYPDAVRALQGLLGLDPVDQGALKDLVTASLETRQYAVAVDAVQRLRGRAVAIAGLDVEEMEWVWGCRGTPGDNVLSPADDEVAKLKPRNNTCVEDVVLEPPCAPCETPTEDKDSALFDRDMMKFRDDERNRIVDVLEAWTRGKQALQERTEKLEKLFPDRAWCHVRLRNRAPVITPEAQKAVVATVVTAPDAAPDVKTAVVTLPPVRTQQTLDLWMRLPAGPGSRCVLANGKNPEGAKKQLGEHYAGGGKPLALRETAWPRRTCTCFGK